LEPDTKYAGGTPVPLRRRAGFTLIELVLVLALLAMAVAVAAPSLSRFFRGRTLDNEARRMLSVTRFAQSRAVSEGVPMLMWFRSDTGQYGLLSETTFTDTDTKAVTYELDSDLAMEVDSLQFAGESPWKLAAQTTGSKQVIRFTPDGFVDENSPNWVWLKTADETDATWLVLSTNRLNYELGSLQPELPR
jgi:type II secretion system protein H